MAIENLSLVGGHICLDFVNTVGNHLTDQPGDWLTSYHDLVVWGQHAGALTETEAKFLIRLSNDQPEAADLALEWAKNLRETIYRLLLSAIRQETPEQTDIQTLNQSIAELPARVGVTYDGARYIWQFPSGMDRLDAALWRVVWAAGDLLTSDQLAQVKVCEGDGCGWMFLDTSRNRTRRWCSMADCGNRAKANRYYQRHRNE